MSYAGRNARAMREAMHDAYTTRMPGAIHATQRDATNATTNHQPAMTHLSRRAQGAGGFGYFASLVAHFLVAASSRNVTLLERTVTA